MKPVPSGTRIGMRALRKQRARSGPDMQKVRAAPILQEKSANADRPIGVTSYIAGFFAVGGSILFNRR